MRRWMATRSRAAGGVASIVMAIVAGVAAAPHAQEAPKAFAPGDSESLGIGRVVDDPALEAESRRIVVIALRDLAEPWSARDGERWAALAKSHAARDVSFLRIALDPKATAESMAADAAAHGVAARDLLDPDGRLARALRARATGEWFLLDRAHRLRYRGAFDESIGRDAAGAERTRGHLAAALDALLAGERIAVAVTAAPGRALATAGAPADAAPAANPALTWSSRIAALSRARCEPCHCEGGAAPFPLSERDDFLGNAAMIREVVAAGVMPPWVATKSSGPFLHDISLRDDEKRDLLRWLQAGCPVGENATPLPPYVAPSGWVIGQPDLIVESPEDVPIPSSGVVEYLERDAPTNLTEPVWFTAAQVLCQHPSICHHIAVRAIYPDKRQEFIGFFLPGSGPTVYPDGFAMELKPGAVIRFDFHYTPDGVERTERSAVGFRFAKEPPKQRVTSRILSRTGPIRIRPGEENHEISYEYVFPYPTHLRRLMPHMHLRGKSVVVELTMPDGTVTRPLELARWHPDWQFAYEFVTPIAIPEGAKIRCTHLFDNSAKNPFNPDPKAGVRAGPQIWDEMACVYTDTFTPADEPEPRWEPLGQGRKLPGGKRSTAEGDGDGDDQGDGGKDDDG